MNEQVFGNPPGDPFEMGEFWYISHEPLRCPDLVAISSIKAVAKTFSLNMGRTIRCAQFPPLICARAAARQYLEGKVRTVLFGDIDHMITADESPAVMEEFQRQAEAFGRAYSASPDSGKTGYFAGLNILNELCEDEESPARAAVEAILASLVVGTWTAFEVLVGDLWIATINERPSLGIRALGAEPDSDDNPEERKKKLKMQFSMSIPLLREFDYNVKNRMGTLLRNKWDFARRNEAKDAYLKTFRRKNERKSLEEILDDNNLGWLAALRNAVIHNGLVADREFVQLTQGHPNMSKVKDGEPIPLRGPLIRGFMEAASRRGVELIKFVDNWLLNNIE